MGVGDRFNHQAKAQLNAIMQAGLLGVGITPVWNKSFREHQIIHSKPTDTRQQADEAIKALNWKGDYFVDADHINLNSVELFIESSDFFTIDVADSIGTSPEAADLEDFYKKNEKFIGELELCDLCIKIIINEEKLRAIGNKYLAAVKQAAAIYNKIKELKGNDEFVVEVSMDETDNPQSPVELFFILSALADEKIPVQTIAPKFSGRFNKGVDYIGDENRFKREFELDINVLNKAIEVFNLPDNLKLSVHSGSDKFSIYEPIKELLKSTGAGLHIKTAGTTWLEELIGLASAGDEGLNIAKEIYTKSFQRFDELCGPYKTVIDINTDRLPLPNIVAKWEGKLFAETLRHDLTNSNYNLNFRQLLHVGYKVAAEMGDRYINALEKYSDVIGENVTENILERHIKRIFL